MQAKVGDKLVTRGRKVGGRDRVAEILEVRGENGAPPYLVRWVDQPGEHIFFPGTDAEVEHLPTN